MIIGINKFTRLQNDLSTTLPGHQVFFLTMIIIFQLDSRRKFYYKKCEILKRNARKKMLAI